MSERQNCFWGATVYSYTAEKGSRRFNKYINTVKMVLYDLLVCYLAFIALISTTYGHILLHLSPLWIFLWSWLLCQRYLLFFFVKSYLIEPVRVECIFSHLALSLSLAKNGSRFQVCMWQLTFFLRHEWMCCRLPRCGNWQLIKLLCKCS